MPRPDHNRPITGQLCVWIWAALLNTDVCQHPSLCLARPFLFTRSLSFCIYPCLIKSFLPVQPTSFNTRLQAISTPTPPGHPPPNRAAFCSFQKITPRPLLFPISQRSKASISSSDEGSCCVSKPTLHRRSLHKTFNQRQRYCKVTKRQRQEDRKKIAIRKERLRQAEKIHLEEVCRSNSCSVVDGEGRKMINEMKVSDL